MIDNNNSLVAFLLDGKGSGVRIGWNEVLTWSPRQGYLWVHLNLTEQYARDWLSDESGLDLISTSILLAPDSRPRSLLEPKGLVVCLRGVNQNPGQDPEDMVSIRLWLDKNRVITTHKRRLLSTEDIEKALEEGCGPKTPADFLRMLNERLINRMSDVIEVIDDTADSLEEDVLNEESYLLRSKIADTRRISIMLRRFLAPQREALNRLAQENTPFLNQFDKVHLREATDRVVRCIEDLDSIRDRSAVTQEELASRLSEQLDRRMYLLSFVAVIFLPLSFITGLLGINVGGIPGANYQWAFFIVCSALLGLLFLMLFAFHRKKWI